MRLRWKLEPRETGLRAVGAGPRPSTLHDGTTRYAMVYAHGRNYDLSGWYWVAGWESGIPSKNTCREPVETAEQAKADCMTYVKGHLK